MAQLTDYLAAERTFLAWLRTGLALMGFGFVVARFGLFLRQIQLVEQAAPAHTSGLSLWFGTALIVAGILVNAFSTWRHMQMVREIQQDQPSSMTTRHVVVLAVFLGLVGVAMAFYLLTLGGSAGLQR